MRTIVPMVLELPTTYCVGYYSFGLSFCFLFSSESPEAAKCDSRLMILLIDLFRPLPASLVLLDLWVASRKGKRFFTFFLVWFSLMSAKFVPMSLHLFFAYHSPGCTQIIISCIIHHMQVFLPVWCAASSSIAQLCLSSFTSLSSITLMMNANKTVTLSLFSRILNMTKNKSA